MERVGPVAVAGTTMGFSVAGPSASDALRVGVGWMGRGFEFDRGSGSASVDSCSAPAVVCCASVSSVGFVPGRGVPSGGKLFISTGDNDGGCSFGVVMFSSYDSVGASADDEAAIVCPSCAAASLEWMLRCRHSLSKHPANVSSSTRVMIDYEFSVVAKLGERVQACGLGRNEC